MLLTRCFSIGHRGLLRFLLGGCSGFFGVRSSVNLQAMVNGGSFLRIQGAYQRQKAIGFCKALHPNCRFMWLLANHYRSPVYRQMDKDGPSISR